jgi:hypothetical protein
MIVYRGGQEIDVEQEKFMIQGLLERTKIEFGGNDIGASKKEGELMLSLFGS